MSDKPTVGRITFGPGTDTTDPKGTAEGRLRRQLEYLHQYADAKDAEIASLRDALRDLVRSIEETFDTRRGELKHLRRLNKARQLLLAGGTPETSTPESRQESWPGAEEDSSDV